MNFVFPRPTLTNNLVLSGHVHGGIIRLFNKGLLDPARKLFPKYDKGLYQIGNTKLFVVFVHQ